jgi:peptidoglycan/LPS O-acetylase OafA/YrhL
LTPRNYTLDYLRGASALIVAMGHQGLIPFENTKYGLMAYAAVMLFFIISGYAVSMSNYGRVGNHKGRFLLNRFFRLYPVYWISIIVTVVLANKEKFDISNIFINATLMQNFLGVEDINLVFWSLQYEVIFYIYYLIIFNIIKKLKVNYICFISILILAILFGYLRGESGTHFPVIILTGLSLFLYGSIYYELMRLKKIKLIISTAIIYIVIIYIISEIAFGVNGFSKNFSSLQYFNSLAIPIAIFSMAMILNLPSSFFIITSKASY